MLMEVLVTITKVNANAGSTSIRNRRKKSQMVIREA